MTHVSCDCCGDPVNSYSHGKFDTVCNERRSDFYDKSFDLCEGCAKRILYFIRMFQHCDTINFYKNDELKGSYTDASRIDKSFEWCKSGGPKITIP